MEHQGIESPGETGDENEIRIPPLTWEKRMEARVEALEKDMRALKKKMRI